MPPCIPLLSLVAGEQMLRCLAACRRSNSDSAEIRPAVSRCLAPWTIESCESRVSAAEKAGSLPSIGGGRDSLLLRSLRHLERPPAGRWVAPRFQSTQGPKTMIACLQSATRARLPCGHTSKRKAIQASECLICVVQHAQEWLQGQRGARRQGRRHVGPERFVLEGLKDVSSDAVVQLRWRRHSKRIVLLVFL